ncbi:MULTISPECIES: carbon-nitrogen hydrolase family protein [Kordiimonas]|jgi:predicted amidohydrolase|uniref:carbon-nitrogen hydrolase family protein n=1 Tax=Kordiimonas TaxID=288021 RepID=UPI00257F90E6|nr:carbon-nitrogen hydrolase family protein [Kordiimonas sp. UBA4487]
MANTFAAAQITSIRGDVSANLALHRQVMEQAAMEGVDVLVFPELSVTGYEMDLAASLQTSAEDIRFMPLQALAREAGMLAYLGMPLKAPDYIKGGKPYLGAVILGGDAPMAYAKIHVHDSEAIYFQSGTDYSVTPHKGARVGAAICADLTKPCHAAGTVAAGADVYAVGALINADAWTREEPLLRGYATEHGIPVAFSNYASKSGPYTPVGKSSVWAPGGDLVAQAEGNEDALVIARRNGGDWQGKTVAL